MNKDDVVVGIHSTGEINDFRRCKRCKMGASYHYLLAAGTTIQCPHCGAISRHVRI